MGERIRTVIVPQRLENPLRFFDKAPLALLSSDPQCGNAVGAVKHIVLMWFFWMTVIANRALCKVMSKYHVLGQGTSNTEKGVLRLLH